MPSNPAIGWWSYANPQQGAKTPMISAARISGGSFDVEVVFYVPPEGLVIAASDPAQFQSAALIVTVGG